jgi:hypothetical protein
MKLTNEDWRFLLDVYVATKSEIIAAALVDRCDDLIGQHEGWKEWHKRLGEEMRKTGPTVESRLNQHG